MICLSIANATVEEAKELMKQFELVELRLDKLQWGNSQLEDVLSQSKNCILTCRESSSINQEKRKALLETGIKHSAQYLDLDMNNDVKFNTDLIRQAKDQKVTLIISYHNYEYTPPLPVLKKYIEEHFLMGANISKIACYCSNELELSRIFSLYYNQNALLALAMGEKGKISRLAALDLGAPFTYVSINDAPTAAGQFSYDSFIEIRKKIDG